MEHVSHQKHLKMVLRDLKRKFAELHDQNLQIRTSHREMESNIGFLDDSLEEQREKTLRLEKHLDSEKRESEKLRDEVIRLKQENLLLVKELNSKGYYFYLFYFKDKLA